MTRINSATTSVIHETVGSTGSQLANGGVEAAGAPLLPEPAGSGGMGVDAGQAMAILMIDSAFARRTTARDAKTKAESAAADAQKQQLHEMREAAEDRYDAAKLDAWVQIGSGAASLGGTALGTAGTKLRNGNMESIGNAVSGGMKAGGTDLAKGIGGFHSSAERHTAELADAAAKQHEYTAKLMNAIGDDWGDDVQAAKESVRKALDFLKEYQSTQSQTQAAALHRA